MIDPRMRARPAPNSAAKIISRGLLALIILCGGWWLARSTYRDLVVMERTGNKSETHWVVAVLYAWWGKNAVFYVIGCLCSILAPLPLLDLRPKRQRPTAGG